MRAVDLVFAPDTGIERALRASSVRSVVYFARVSNFVSPALVVDGAVAALAQIGVFGPLVAETEVSQDAGRQSGGLAMEREQHRSDADEAVAHVVRFFFRHPQHFGGLRRDEDLERALAAKLQLVALGGEDEVDDRFLGLRCRVAQARR